MAKKSKKSVKGKTPSNAVTTMRVKVPQKNNKPKTVVTVKKTPMLKPGRVPNAPFKLNANGALVPIMSRKRYKTIVDCLLDPCQVTSDDHLPINCTGTMVKSTPGHVMLLEFLNANIDQTTFQGLILTISDAKFPIWVSTQRASLFYASGDVVYEIDWTSNDPNLYGVLRAANDESLAICSLPQIFNGVQYQVFGNFNGASGATQHLEVTLTDPGDEPSHIIVTTFLLDNSGTISVITGTYNCVSGGSFPAFIQGAGATNGFAITTAPNLPQPTHIKFTNLENNNPWQVQGIQSLVGYTPPEYLETLDQVDIMRCNSSKTLLTLAPDRQYGGGNIIEAFFNTEVPPNGDIWSFLYGRLKTKLGPLFYGARGGPTVNAEQLQYPEHRNIFANFLADGNMVSLVAIKYTPQNGGAISAIPLQIKNHSWLEGRTNRRTAGAVDLTENYDLVLKIINAVASTYYPSENPTHQDFINLAKRASDYILYSDDDIPVALRKAFSETGVNLINKGRNIINAAL
jgi:hypothetical protein